MEITTGILVVLVSALMCFVLGYLLFKESEVVYVEKLDKSYITEKVTLEIKIKTLEKELDKQLLHNNNLRSALLQAEDKLKEFDEQLELIFKTRNKYV